MYHQLSAFMQMPEPYQPNVHPFWDDEHISAQMLKAHLNPDQDAASRTHAFMDASAAWIAQLIPPEEYPRLLDLGCGPGLYTQRFAQKGYQVTGVDLSRRSIQYAEEHTNGIKYHLCNYCRLDLAETFDLITLIYCDFGVLSPADRHEVLKRAHAHLRPGGKMLLDMFASAHEAKDQPCQRWQHCPEGGFWRKDPYIVLEEKRLYPDHVIGQQITVITEQNMTSYYLWNTCFTPERLAGEAEKARFRLANVYGNVTGAPYTRDSDVLAVVLEAL